VLAFTLACYAACFPADDPLAYLLYGLPSTKKAESYELIAALKVKKLAAMPNTHPRILAEAKDDARLLVEAHSGQKRRIC
jgi:hypothetical protein